MIDGPDDMIRRNALGISLAQHLSPGFLVVPPTVRFPHTAVANGEMGICAVVVLDGIALYDKEDRRWYGADVPIDPERIAYEARIDLAAAARAPLDRVAAVVWLPNAYTDAEVTGVCASPNPRDTAQAVEKAIMRVAAGTDAPLSPWLGAYVSAASGPKGPLNDKMRRLTALIQKEIEVLFGDGEPVIAGSVLTAADFADPRFLLPAVLTAASEDWSIVRHVVGRNGGNSANHPGFVLHLTPDPSALLGYRVDDVTPATQFLVHGPIISVLKRFRFEGGEFAFEDLIGQFGRFLEKNGYDATVVEDYEIGLATSS